jgi:hypothetical protein
MTNKLLIVGRMFELTLQPITRNDFKKLMKEGYDGDLYDQLRSDALSNSEVSGYYLYDSKPTFEVYINDEPINLSKSFKNDYEITYLPVIGETKAKIGREEFFFVTEHIYKQGHSGLHLNEDFNKRDLTFTVERQGLYNKMICSTITPYYQGKELEFYWNWSGYDSSYIITTKGRTLPIGAN